MKKDTFENYVKEYCTDLANKKNSQEYHRCKHAAVLTYNNVIISSGVNIKLKNDFTKPFNNLKALHAEPAAIMRAMKRHSKIIHKCELWVCRENQDSHQSKPCIMCQNIIKSFGIHKVHFTNENGKWEIMKL